MPGVWFPRVQVRSTRSGAQFSPFTATPFRAQHKVDLAELLRASTAAESQESYADVEAELPQAEVSHPAPVEDPPVLEPTPPASPPPPKKRPAPETPPPEPEPPRKQSRANFKRRQRRDAKFEASGHIPSERTLRDAAVNAAPIPTTLRTDELPVKHGAYSAKSVPLSDPEKVWTVEELLAAGFELVEWDGCTPRPLIDVENRIYAVLAGQPNDPTYNQAVEEAFRLVMEAGAGETFSKGEREHRQGHFPALAMGVAYGTGQLQPMELAEGVEGKGKHASVLQRLVGAECVRRMAAYAEAAFSLWAPRVHDYYKTRLDTVYRVLPHLKPLFPKSIFPAATFNFGPNVWTFKHRDILNCPFGWCGVTALGIFDPTKGGHLILWDAKLVIQFPAGSTILIPSATLTHSNIPVGPGERRASFTQYCAGAIFRWVDNGCRLEEVLKQEDPDEYAKVCAAKATR